MVAQRRHSERLGEEKIYMIREERLRKNGKDKAGDIGRVIHEELSVVSLNFIVNFILKV